jgi:hypothetical protein
VDANALQARVVAEEPGGFAGIAHEYAHGSMGVQQPLDDCAADPPGGADDGDSHEVSFRSVGIAFACAGCPVEVALDMNAEIARQLPAAASSCGRCRFR